MESLLNCKFASFLNYSKFASQMCLAVNYPNLLSFIEIEIKFKLQSRRGSTCVVRCNLENIDIVSPKNLTHDVSIYRVCLK